jgi:4-hydroxy-3-methylbut-2-enyl diphosphate reductase
MEDLNIILAKPRGFCAGVVRAIQIVEKAIVKYGAPVYVRHEIVHNRFVVECLQKKGAIFVDKVSDAPHDRPIIFSAHGVPKSVTDEAKLRQMLYIDATCPLVSKVHKMVERHYANNMLVILIGHAGHPEVEGTMGQLPKGAVLLVENLFDVENLSIDKGTLLAYATQTTLSVDETRDIVDALKKKFPQIAIQAKDDICYATTNRQMAVKSISKKVDGIIVMGSPNSSNSMRLVEVAKQNGCPKSLLLQRAADMNWDWLQGVKTLGVTAGASAPEVLIDELIAKCRQRYSVKINEETVIQENVVFHVPKSLSV